MLQNICDASFMLVKIFFSSTTGLFIAAAVGAIGGDPEGKL